MAGPDSCDPCGTCIPPNMTKEWFMQALLTAICGISVAVGGPGLGGPTAEELGTPPEGPLGEIPGTSPAVFTSGSVAGFGGKVTDDSFVTLINNNTEGKILTIDNNLDVDVIISIDAATTAFVVLKGLSKTIELADAGLSVNSNVYAKAIGSASAAGMLYASLIS